MIRFHTSRSAADAVRYYTHLSQGDYYAQGGGFPSVRGGRLLEPLGLSGEETREEFAALAGNRHPKTGEQLTPRMKQDRRAGVDVTADVAKSASIMWAVGGDERIPDLVMRVDQEVMAEMEKDMRVRLRAGGQDGDKVTGEGAWSSHLHGTSRPGPDDLPDMHLHVHNFWWNITRSDGRFFAAETGEMHRKSDLYRRLFDAKMSEGLRQLGYQVERRGNSYEIAGISRALIEKFSRRTEEIEEEARRKGITDPDEKDALGGKTRRAKRTDVNDAQLRAYWKSRLTGDEAAQIAAVRAEAAAREQAGGVPPSMTAGQSVDWAVRHVFEKDAVVEDWKVTAAALAYGVDSVSADAVSRDIEQKITDGALLAGTKDGRRLLTTPQAHQREQKMIAFARDGRGTCKPLVGSKRPISRDWLNEQQQKGVRWLWQSCDRVMLLRGAPGVGKSTLLEEAVEGIEANGHRVFAFAPSAEASRGTLREWFPEAETVQMLIKNERLQERVRGSVLICDEAGLMGARDASEFFRLCERLDCRAIIIGDKNQHSAVELPGTLRLLETEANLPVAEVTEIQRQKGAPRYKEVVEKLVKGDTDGALKRLQKLGWVREITDGPEREQQLAADYLQAVSKKKRGKPVTALVISPTHVEGQRIAGTIRLALKERGTITGPEHELPQLDRIDLTEAERGDARRYAEGEVVQFFQNAPGFQRGQRVTVTGRDDLGRVCVRTDAGEVKPLRLDLAERFQVFRPTTLKVAAGDRIRITSGGRDKSGEHRLDNGMLHTVRGFSSKGDLVLDNGWVVPQSFSHIAQGYVITSQASQSKTVDCVFAGMSAQSFKAMSREGLLVTLSRGRDRAVIYTDDLEGVKNAARRSEERLTATELLKEQARRREEEAQHVRHMQRWVRAVGDKAGALARVFGLPYGQDLAAGPRHPASEPAVRRRNEPPPPERTR